MRAALTLLFAAALLPASARAQVTVQDIATTFLSERENHQARIDGNAQKWWNGDTGDRAATTYENADYTMVPGNPLTVAPLFSMEEMLGADNPQDYPGSPDDLIPRTPDRTGENAASTADPVTPAQLSAGMIDNAAARINAAFGNNSGPAQPIGATETLPDIAPPPVQDEQGAVFLDPADAAPVGAEESETLAPDTTRGLP